MKKFIVDDREKNLILQMHKSLIKEQTTGNISHKDSPEYNFFIQAIEAKCLKDGNIIYKKSTGQYIYRKESVKYPGTTVDLFADKTYKYSNGSKSGTWACPGVDSPSEAAIKQKKSETESKIATYKKQKYETLDELKSKNVDLTTLDRYYDKINVDGIDLYKLKISATNLTTDLSTPEFNAEQQAFINNWTSKTGSGKGYKLNPTSFERTKLQKITPEELGAPKELFPDGFFLWYDPNEQKNIKRKDDSVLRDILTNQSVDRKVCRKNINDYYKLFQLKNSATVSPADLTKAKKIVQACKDQHYGKWGVLGGGDKFDNYLDILSDTGDPVWRLK